MIAHDPGFLVSHKFSGIVVRQRLYGDMVFPIVLVILQHGNLRGKSEGLRFWTSLKASCWRRRRMVFNAAMQGVHDTLQRRSQTIRPLSDA
jgi:hypothetical protein